MNDEKITWKNQRHETNWTMFHWKSLEVFVNVKAELPHDIYAFFDCNTLQSWSNYVGYWTLAATNVIWSKINTLTSYGKSAKSWKVEITSFIFGFKMTKEWWIWNLNIKRFFCNILNKKKNISFIRRVKYIFLTIFIKFSNIAVINNDESSSKVSNWKMDI